MSTLTLRPNSDSSVAQSRSSGASNYALIDEATENTADYCYHNSKSTSSTTDIYAFPNHSTESGAISAVRVKAQAKWNLQTTGSGSITLLVRIGSTNYNSGAVTLLSGDYLIYKEWTENPATSSAWTWTNIDDLLAGDTLAVVGDGKLDQSSICYQLWVEVDYTEGGGSTVFLPNIMKHNFIPPLIGGY